MSLFELGKALLCSTCFIYGLSILSIDLSILPGLSNSNNGPRNPLNCTILDNSLFDNIILADKLFVKALRSLETCCIS